MVDLAQSKIEDGYWGPSLSGVDKYELEWRNILTIANDITLYDLRHAAVRGDLRASPFRSICWAVFLGVLKRPSAEWSEQRKHLRNEYRTLKNRYVLNPHQNSDGGDDPLSQAKQSLWNQHFCDQELCAVINQDVVRTFPGVEFFRKSSIQKMMTNILFCYARMYPSMCYRQGMHEILAPLIFVIHSDQQTMAHIQELDPKVDPNLITVLDPSFLEEDSFAIFLKIMEQIASFYRITDLVPTATGHFPLVTPSTPTSPDSAYVARKRTEIEVVERLNYIKDRILIKEDLHLHNHLLKLDVPLAIFGIRWLRLLFGREFTLQDLLLLWDAIFGEGDDLGLINFVVVAMLIRIRDKLIYSDYTTCLTYLMRYPSNVDVSLVIRHALHMKSPKQPVMRSRNIELEHLKYSTLPNMHRRQVTADHPLQGSDERIRTASLPRKSGSLRKLTANDLREKAMKAAVSAAAASNQGEIARDSDISDGYLEDDPELMKIELQEAYNVMSLSRAKLLQYLSVLRRHVHPPNPIGELQQSLEGIEEICSLLKPRYDTVFRVSVPIDAATEANEDHSHSKRSGTAPPAQRTQTPPTSLNLQRSYNYDLDCRRNSAANILQYEIPEDRYSGIVTKKLANRKEVEMHVFQQNFADRRRRIDDKELPIPDPLQAGRTDSD
ncbi:TBC1 domain family member 5 isoform X2 [Toxorhynchites rutilus septentrionalis]|uniref:TBC1 domain family member 5 isoform X2 n=1 Tax=Toxorhynchites rutilus septentrionalis TaxID=329112 RepID=UPI00247AE07A|nr:TBC1 domain family member 5 isoform X2 [Toxorhynchites rutilus septentrionalis]